MVFNYISSLVMPSTEFWPQWFWRQVFANYWYQVLRCSVPAHKIAFLPALVRTYNAGLSLALLLLSSCSSCGHINQNTALLSNFTMLSAYCTISCTFAPQPCPATLPGPAAFPGSFARQPCSAALGRHAALHTFTAFHFN
jgi:hypothetical protein